MTNPTIEAVREAMRARQSRSMCYLRLVGHCKRKSDPTRTSAWSKSWGQRKTVLKRTGKQTQKTCVAPCSRFHAPNGICTAIFRTAPIAAYFLGNLLEHDRETPVLFAQIGACQIERNDDGSVKPVRREVKPYLLLAMDAVSEGVQETLLQTAHAKGVEVVNLAETDELTQHRTPDLRLLAQNKVRYKMHELEVQLAQAQLTALNSDEWLVVDGSLQFPPVAESVRRG